LHLSEGGEPVFFKEDGEQPTLCELLNSTYTNVWVGVRGKKDKGYQIYSAREESRSSLRKTERSQPSGNSSTAPTQRDQGAVRVWVAVRI